MEHLNDFNFTNLSDSQLECLIFDAKNEKARRDTEKKKKYWAKVCEAIQEYVDNVGEINVFDFYNKAHIDPTDTLNLSEMGIIKSYLE